MDKRNSHPIHDSNPTATKKLKKQQNDEVGSFLQDYETFMNSREQERQKDKLEDEQQMIQFAGLPKTELIGLFFDEKLKYQRPPYPVDPVFGSMSSHTTKPSHKKRDKFQKTIFGYCRECNEKVNGGLQAMKEHILSCPKLNTFKEGEACKDIVMRFKVYPEYGDMWNKYWLFIEVPFTSNLRELDDVIRNYWVECCGHLSKFDVDTLTYNSYESDNEFMDEIDNKTMDIPMYRVFKPSDVGKTFCYTYDFGSSTYLELELISIVKCNEECEEARVLARNNPLTFKCCKCKNEAEYVQVEESVLYCKKHAKDEDEDMLLPVVNSPRMGVCGYTNDMDTYAPPSEETKKKKTKHQ
ncbi:hypothetical protein C9374_002480 [Naegleria lovaniensis]|uniref:Plasmid pRiA4b Orf3-like domain-containing protein n=1 Tax=Naegleria lovaniensis TaxID=51637 RepID=A0AA88GVQ5_NAELO|nr:uncharacterized protein C9374_002480 [Naegleria lovaniensis]KAG2386736.1 hypothetical protein C9374_002480 [Naegleria lovaniensis]